MNDNNAICTRNLGFIALGVSLFFSSFCLFAATVEQETLAYVNQIRTISAKGDRSAIEDNNQKMDEAWKYFNANKKSALPVLRKELTQEVAKEIPSNLVLLDIGYFIRLQGDAADKELGKKALFKIDPTAEIVRRNQDQLFYFAHSVASDQNPQTLPFLDNAFLKSKVSVFIPQHALTLDETLVCVFLYGIQGKASEDHLRSLLKDKSLAPKIIEILVWLGSPDSVQDVKDAMMANPNYETFVRGTTFMMKAGGPEGRAAMLALDAKAFDVKTQDYYLKVRKSIDSVSFDNLRKQFDGLPGDAKIRDEDLKKRLTAMYDSYGKDDTLNPSTVLNSGLARQFLISELTRIRGRSFYRISDEALSDVEMTNALLNVLYYKRS